MKDNYKIEVKTKQESNEIQELFFSLGFDWKDSGKNIIGFWSKYCFYYTENGFLLKTDSHRVFKLLDSMQITIEQLRDMVVLKRNDCKDRTHVDSNNYDWYVASDEKHYRHQGSIWVYQPYVSCLELKSIQKEKTMKEWIYKDGSGKYVLTTDPEVANLAADAVEVPNGAQYMTMPNYYFWRDQDPCAYDDVKNNWSDNDGESMQDYLNGSYSAKIVWQREKPQEKCADKLPMEEALEFAEELRNMGESGWSKEKHSHYKKGVSHLNVIDPYRIADLYDLHPCAEHIMKKSLCAGGRGHKDLLRDIQDIIDTAERWKEMIEEDNREV